MGIFDVIDHEYNGVCQNYLSIVRNKQANIIDFDTFYPIDAKVSEQGSSMMLVKNMVEFLLVLLIHWSEIDQYKLWILTFV